MNSARNSKSLIASRICAFALFLIAVFILQTVFAHKFAIFGVAPLIILPATIAVGMFGGHTTGMVFGLVLGLAVDSTVGPIFGYYALVLMLVGIVAGFFVEIVAWRRLLAVQILLAVCYFVAFVAIFLWDLIILSDFSGLGTKIGILVAELVYSSILEVGCYYVCLLINKRYNLQDD